MDPLSEKIRKMIASKQLKISMSEVARVTGVSTSQLRYWEKKGILPIDVFVSIILPFHPA